MELNLQFRSIYNLKRKKALLKLQLRINDFSFFNFLIYKKDQFLISDAKNTLQIIAKKCNNKKEILIKIFNLYKLRNKKK